MGEAGPTASASASQRCTTSPKRKHAVGDLAGEVVELGSGVTNFKPGNKVISISFPSGGGLAEYAVAPASLTVKRPSEVSAVLGACLLAAVGLVCSSRPPSPTSSAQSRMM
ncbi:hypothetical protein ZWY2020_020986 [Hordeum vulgare]|nr:hypothetical protein ZWY2020_020986 [Hordeum vulgare]